MLATIALVRAVTGLLVAPAIAAAHHGADEGGGSGFVLWGAVALALAVLLLFRWLAVARRRRGDAHDTEPDE